MPRPKQFVVISYYTDNWEYPERAAQLRDDCERFGLRNDIVRLDDQGSWIKNTRLKSRFVHEKLEEHQRPVLWIDADSRILKSPLGISNNADIGGVRALAPTSKIFYAGTLFFNYTDGGRDFARRWAECNIKGSDHAALDRIWQEGFDGIVHCLPYTYCQVESRKDVTDDAVIVSGSSTAQSKQEYFNRNPYPKPRNRRRTR